MLLLTTCNFFLSCCYAIGDDFVVEDRGTVATNKQQTAELY